MIQSNFFQGRRSFSLVLICAMLGACSTMQKSSTGSGEQTAAPISEASKSADGTKAAGGSTANSSASASPSTGAARTGSPPKPAGAVDGNSGTLQGSSDSGKSAAANEEEAQLKRQLADQDAQINKLRVEQEAEAARDEAEAAKMREQQVAAAGATGQEPAAGAAATSALNKGRDEAAVFPANASAAESGSTETEAAVQRAAERSVYFGYNQSTVPEKYDDMLLANAAWLKAHPDVKAEVQGNCDERGSREYNLALGSRRAMAVKRALELAGAEGGRIAAISYGSEKPVATGKDEDSYSKNRRADIVY